MQDDIYQKPRQRTTTRSIDGFRRPLPRNATLNAAPKPPIQSLGRDGRTSSVPKFPPSPASSRSGQRTGSLLNTTIPGATSSPFRYPPATKESKKRIKLTRRQIIKRSVLAFSILVIGVGGFFGYKDLSVINKVFHGNLYSDAQALFGNTKLNGESTGRVNILLAGYQGSESDEGPLTDSIMVVSLDTQNNTAFTMSIPRDLWVDVPGIGHEKINAANTNTSFNQPGYFSGGMGQLQEIVEHDLGIPINYYALIDYTAFEDAVNAVGGITINIQSPDPRGLYDPNVNKAHGGPVKLPNGPVTLNGMSALALALARGDSPYAYGFPQSDINRTQHQRQMLIALEQKATTAGVLSNPITISKLVNALGNNVTTNLTLPDVLRAAQLAKQVNTANIQSYGLSYSGVNALLTTYTAPDGEDALIPRAGLDNFSQIQQYYKQITSSKPAVK
jgi:LCP family protein required for cell wall assembly